MYIPARVGCIGHSYVRTKASRAPGKSSQKTEKKREDPTRGLRIQAEVSLIYNRTGGESIAAGSTS
jgi:hypothetical protein